MSERDPRVSRLSVVIPSRSAANLQPCVEAVRQHEPEARILLVDDGVDFNEWECRGLVTADLARLGMRPVDGVKPFIFARNCNLGIAAAGDDDVILLNDDAILETPSGFSAMQQAAIEHPEYGVISATTNLAGNPAQQRRAQHGLRIVDPMPAHSAPVVAFVCVLIPRRTIQLVGVMDERFGGITPEGKRIYGYCDNSYCRTVHNAGLKIGVCDSCYVDHARLKSSFRSEPHDMEASRRIYVAKWGKM